MTFSSKVEKHTTKALIVIPTYTQKQAKLQPWYSVEQIKKDLSRRGLEVEQISDFQKIPSNFNGIVIHLWGPKHLFSLPKERRYKLYSLICFPMYPFQQFLSLSIKSALEQFTTICRLSFFACLPKSLILKGLRKTSCIITSDRLEEFFQAKGFTYTKYYPYQQNNWGTVKKPPPERNACTKTIGYFGSPILTRYFDQVIKFFHWTDKQKANLNKLILSRTEKQLWKKNEQKLISKYKIKNLNIVSGFLEREALLNYLTSIDILILPFRIVVAEFPVVVLEALELGIPVITTKDSGIHYLAKTCNQVLLLPSFKESYFPQALDFIKHTKPKMDSELFRLLEKHNEQALNHLLTCS